jgi:glycerol transport system ATP-binding protein
VGSAEDLFERPAHSFVGHFIGSPGMNFLPAVATSGRLTVAGVAMPAPAGLPEGNLKLGVRPEYLALAAAHAAGALPAVVQRVQDVGTHTMLTLALGDAVVKSRLASEAGTPVVGSTVWLQAVGKHSCFYKDELLV